MKTTTPTYKILHVEDFHPDAELVARELKKAGVHFDQRIVQTRSEYIEALDQFAPDIVLCDHSLPSFNSHEALTILKQSTHQVPFIVITATMSESIAFQVLVAGADDYILKDRLTRLPYAVLNALDKSKLEKDRTDFFSQVKAKEEQSIQQLKMLTDKYRQIVETTQEGIWIFDKKYKTTFVNQQISEIVGYSKEEMLGQSVFDLMDMKTSGEKRKLFSLRKKDRNVTEEFTLIAKNGERVWVSASAAPFFDDHGHYEGTMAMIMNITERKQAELQLVNSERNYRQVFQMSPVPQMICDLQTHEILMVNEAACSNYQYTASEFVTKAFHDLVSESDRDISKEVFCQLSTLKNNVETVLKNYTNSRKEIIVNMQAAIIMQNEKECVLVTLSDITERVNFSRKISDLKVSAQKKITRAQINGQERERHQLGEDLHDNINQQLCTAKLYLAIAQKNPQMQPDLVEKSKTILDNAINDIRALSKTLVPTNIKAVGLDNALNDLLKSYSAVGVFEVNLDVDGMVAKLDEDITLSIYRIVQEQVNNIMKYANARHVSVSLIYSRNAIRLTITDDGKGFDVKASTKGVGLANLKNRVGLHNGSFKIKASPDNGCSILIQIPFNLSAPRKQVVNPTLLKIMLCDSDLLDQEFLKDVILEQLPETSISFTTDADDLINALDNMLTQDLPDLLILDYNLPGLNGYETLLALQGPIVYNAIPKLVFATNMSEEIERECLSAGAKACFKKSSTLDEMRTQVKRIIHLLKK